MRLQDVSLVSTPVVAGVVQATSAAEEDMPMDISNVTVATRLGYTAFDLVELEDNVKSALHNAGNTCYLNSLLHVVARVDSLRQWFQEHLVRSQNAHSWQTCSLCAIAQDVNRLCIDVETTPFVPHIVHSRGLWSHGEFNNSEQQDVTETVRLLFDSLNTVDERSMLASNAGAFDGVSGVASRYTTPMWRLMEMSFESRLHCTSCNEMVIQKERLFSVPLDLPDEACTVELLLANHWGNQPEGDDPFVCPAERPCGAPAAGTVLKTCVPTGWPKVLVLSLKRFRFRFLHGRPFIEKVDTQLSFETLLPICHMEQPYHLRGVIEHHGGQADGGHYTAYVRAVDNYWYYCDDERPPLRVHTDTVLTAQAYVLVYEK